MRGGHGHIFGYRDVAQVACGILIGNVVHRDDPHLQHITRCHIRDRREARLAQFALCGWDGQLPIERTHLDTVLPRLHHTAAHDLRAHVPDLQHGDHLSVAELAQAQVILDPCIVGELCAEGRMEETHEQQGENTTHHAAKLGQGSGFVQLTKVMP